MGQEGKRELRHYKREKLLMHSPRIFHEANHELANIWRRVLLECYHLLQRVHTHLEDTQDTNRIQRCLSSRLESCPGG